jgi:hypothetical protein
MAVGIGAGNFIGLAEEVTPNTYVAPTKFFPIRSEGLQWQQDTVWRRVIAQIADPLGAVPGNGHVEGDLDMELMHDVLPYLLRAARGDIVKSGVDPAFVYTFTPNEDATPDTTLSITVVRNGIVFAYVGVVISSMQFGVDNGMATMNMSLLGTAEQTESLPTISLDDTGPFGSGEWVIEVPTNTQVFDTDSFSLQIEDSGEPQNRLRDSLGAQFIKYGERTVQLSVERDFESKSEYTAFKTLTSKSITVRVEKSADATKYVEFVVPAAIVDTYDVATPGVGDLVRASVSYMGVYDLTDGAYTIEIGTDEDVTIP